MNWFGPVHEYFLGLVGVHEFLAFNFPLHGYVLYLARIPPPPLTFSDGPSRASYSPPLHLYVLALYCVGVYPCSFNNRPYKFGLEEIRPRGIRAQKNPTGRAEAHKGRHNRAKVAMAGIWWDSPWKELGLSTSCSVTFWQLLVFRATFCILSRLSSYLLIRRYRSSF